ncbi:MAG TPA: hypothetical protein VNM14_14010 [Planctomycetota bacterium]|jgi:hypothetical protein|nr:hypothetical protein [Planctomycetota bacterium]
MTITRTAPERTLPRRRAEAVPLRRRLLLRFWDRMKTEAVHLLPGFLFFFLAFSLLRLTQSVILKEAGITTVPPSKVLVGSLIVAKALLTVDKFNLFRRLERRPVLSIVVVKTAVYFVAALLFQYGDGLYEFRHRDLSEASHLVAARFSSPRFWVIQAWLLVLLFAFGSARELARKVGRKRFRKLFFG